MENPTAPDTTEQIMTALHQVMNVLDLCRNMFDQPLSEDCRARIFEYIEEPTQHGWENIRSIIVTSQTEGMGLTVWQVVDAHCAAGHGSHERAIMPSSVLHALARQVGYEGAL